MKKAFVSLAVAVLLAVLVGSPLGQQATHAQWPATPTPPSNVCTPWFSDPWVRQEHRHCGGAARVFIQVFDANTGDFLTQYRLGCWTCQSDAWVTVGYPGYRDLAVLVPVQATANGADNVIDAYLCPIPPTPTPTHTPTDTPTPTPTSTPTPRPTIVALARNPQGTPAAVAELGSVRFAPSGGYQGGYWSNTSGISAYVEDYTSEYTHRGAFGRLYANQVLMGLTPSPGGGVSRTSTTLDPPRHFYGWSNWYTGNRTVVYVVATVTPTRTPTHTPTPIPTSTTGTPTAVPMIAAYAVNPEGTPVPVQRIGKSLFNLSPRRVSSEYVQDASGYLDQAMSYSAGYLYRGAYFRSYPDQILMGIIASHAGGTQMTEANGDVYYGWQAGSWADGRRDVYAVYTTPTPTGPPITDTPTPTPTPTFTPTPAPYTIPPIIRPFLHLRGHEPPYAEQHVDYLTGDTIYYYSQVFMHAVPSAEMVTPPQYCEWTGGGWSCTPADTFSWTSYSFHGVERNGVDFASPVGEVTKAFTSQQHSFDPTPRMTDPTYRWPDEFLHLYFNLPAGDPPGCGVQGAAGPCIVYNNRAPGQEILEVTLHAQAGWTLLGRSAAFDLPARYPVTISATQWEQP